METPITLVSRKDARKQKRIIKKIQMAAHRHGQKVEDYMKNILKDSNKKKKKKKEKRKNEGADNSKSNEGSPAASNPKKKAKISSTKHNDETLTYEQYLEDVKNIQKNSLMGSVQDQADDRAIHTYSRLLGITKNKSCKNEMENDGLDMILNFCDSNDRSKLDDYFMVPALDGMGLKNKEEKDKAKNSKKVEKAKVEEEEDYEDEEDEDDDDENYDDDILAMGDDETDMELDDEDLEDGGSDLEDEDGEEFEDEEFSDGSEDMDEEDEEVETLVSKQKTKKASTVTNKKTAKKRKMEEEDEEEEDDDDDDYDDDEDDDDDEKSGGAKEDIYGRKVNNQGNLIKFDPQAAQKKLIELEASMPLEQRQKMEKTLMSIVNKVSDATLLKSRLNLIEVWNTCSKNEVKKILTNILLKMISTPYRLPDVMLIAYGMFINLIHNTINSEITAHMAEVLVCDYIKCMQGPKVLDDKSLDNKTVLISMMISFRILKTEFILDILNHISKEITEETLHHVILFANYVYLTAKRSFSAAFFQKLEQIHSAYESSSITEQSRGRFIAEQIAKLKKTGPTTIDINLFDNQNKLLRGLYKQNKFESGLPLAMTINDLLHAEETGRWWIVGSAYRLPDDAPKEAQKQKGDPTYSEDILAAASKARMNTTVRKNVFCAVSSCETVDDAVSNLLQLKLKGSKEREIINVLIYMMQAGKTYNPFYSSVIQKLCEANKRHGITLKYALWDKLKDVQTMTDRKRDNFTNFLIDIIRGEVLPITVLKVVDFVTMTVAMANILKGVVVSLEKCGESKLNRILSPLTRQQKAADSNFADGFRVFLEYRACTPLFSPSLYFLYIGVVVSTHELPEKFAVAWCEQFNFSFILWRDVDPALTTYLCPGTLIAYDVEILNRTTDSFRRISSRGYELRAPKSYGNSKHPDFRNIPVAHYSGNRNETYSQRVEWRDSFTLRPTQDEDNLYIAKGHNLTAQIPLCDAMRLVSANLTSFTGVAEVKTESFGDDKYYWRMKEYVYEGKVCTLDEMLARHAANSFDYSPPSDHRRKQRSSEPFARKDERPTTPKKRNFTTAVMKPIMTKTTDVSFKIPDTDMSIFLGLVVNFDMVWIVYSMQHSEFIKIEGSVEMRTGTWYKFHVYDKDPCSHVLTFEHFVCEKLDRDPPNTHIRFLPSRESSRSGLVILVTVLTPIVDVNSGELYFQHPMIKNMMSSEDIIDEAFKFQGCEVMAELTCLSTGWEIMKIHEKTATSNLAKLIDPFFVYEFHFYDEYLEQLRILEELQQLKYLEKSVRKQPSPPDKLPEPPVPEPPKPTIANDLFSFIHKLNIEADKKLGVVSALTKKLETENSSVPENVLDSKENYMMFLKEKFYEKPTMDDRLKISNIMKPKVPKDSENSQSKLVETIVDSDSSSCSSTPSCSKDAKNTNQANVSQAHISPEGEQTLDRTDLSCSVFIDDTPSTSVSQQNLTLIEGSSQPPDDKHIVTENNPEEIPDGNEIAGSSYEPPTTASSFSEEFSSKDVSPVTAGLMKRSKKSSSFFPGISRSKRVMKSLKAETSIANVPTPSESPSDQKCDAKLVQRELSEDPKLLSDSEEELQSLPAANSPITPPPYIPLIGEEIMDDRELEKEEPIGITDDQRFAVGLVVKEYASYVLLYSPDSNFKTILVKSCLIRGSPFDRAGLAAKIGVWMKISMVQPRRPRGRDIEHPPIFSHIAISPPEPFDIQSVSMETPWQQRFFNGIFETYQTVTLKTDDDIPTVTYNDRICYHMQSSFTVWVLIPMERLELIVRGGFSNMNCKLSFWVTRIKCEEVNALFLCDNQPIQIEKDDGTLDELKGKFGLGAAEESIPEPMQSCMKSLPPLTFSDKPDVKIITADNSLTEVFDDERNCSSLQRSLSKQSTLTPNATSTPVASDSEDSDDYGISGVGIIGEVDYPEGDLRDLFIDKLEILSHPRVMETLEEQELDCLMPYLMDWREEMRDQL
ncbi:unnamed protein product [Auanema sp. JU1783]|nr:unnamed protein product [Auanema sp. JU1783]